MLVCILGRQPEISLAELESVFGQSRVKLIAPQIATVDSNDLDLSALGGTIKYGEIAQSIPMSNSGDTSNFISTSRQITAHYHQKWRGVDHKITLGISAYEFKISQRDLQKTGLLLKKSLKKDGVSLRLLPNDQLALSTATSHNNKLGLSDNKVELLIIKTPQSIIIAESRGTQNITAYARRDQNRPKRDAFVGMLPPKLAQIMLNLALGHQEARSKEQEASSRATKSSQQSATRVSQDTRSEAVGNDFGGKTASVFTILDPFCGTGTVLQEALLRGFDVYGSDLNPKMIDYTKENLAWLKKTHKKATGKIIAVHQGDAMTTTWQNSNSISAVVCETYLGQPFSAPPSPEKLKQVAQNCNHIVSEFLNNIHPQLHPDTPLCIAIPAWRDKDGRLTYLPISRKLQPLGYQLVRPPLIYSRPDQVVARQILVLAKTSSKSEVSA